MRSSEDVFNRIKWSAQYSAADIVIGYIDRFVGLMEVSFAQFVEQKAQAHDSFIPYHRVMYFRHGRVAPIDRDAPPTAVDASQFRHEDYLWHRVERIDRVFNSIDAHGDNLERAPQVRKFSQACKFFAAGLCTKGSSCRYVHNLANSGSADDNDDDAPEPQPAAVAAPAPVAAAPAPVAVPAATASRARVRKEENPATAFSKRLTWLLRHGAVESGLAMRGDGFARVSDVLALRDFAQYSEADVRAAVDADAKSRFTLSTIEGELHIRANQGHSMHAVVKTEELLTPITSADAYPTVLHGTYHKAWEAIATQGLMPMARTHVHCSQGLPGDSGVISGMRPDVQIVIVIDLAACLRDGLACHVSSNGVVMLPAVAPTYFSHVLRKNKKTKALEPFDDRWPAPHAALAAASTVTKKPTTKEERVAAARVRHVAAVAASASASTSDDLYAQPTETASLSVCKFFCASSCSFGDRCRSEHDLEKARAVEQEWLATRVDYTSLQRDGRRTQPQLRHLHESKPVAPEFDLLAVLDLEGKEQIIELPVLVMRASDCVEVGRFHTFVAPTTCATPPPLSVPFTQALARLDAFLAPLKEAHGQRLAFVTCGDWDLKTQIPHQARISGIETPQWANAWINIKHVYNRFAEMRVTGMPAMLTQTGIPLVGHHHLGLDDTSNIAKLLAWLRFRGAPIVLTGWRAAADAPVTFRWPDLVERKGKIGTAATTSTDDNDADDVLATAAAARTAAEQRARSDKRELGVDPIVINIIIDIDVLIVDDVRAELAQRPARRTVSQEAGVGVLVAASSGGVALSLTAFLLGVGVAAVERVAIAVVSLDSGASISGFVLAFQPTVVVDGTAAALHRALVRRVVKGAALRRQAPQMKLGNSSPVAAGAPASTSSVTPVPMSPLTPPTPLSPTPSEQRAPTRPLSPAAGQSAAAPSSDVLLSASLLKRRMNTRNKWQIRRCTVDGAGNFTFYKLPESFKAKSLAFSSVSISGPNAFDVAFGRRRDESFAFQFKQDKKDGGAELQRWVDTIRRVIDKLNEDVLDQLEVLQSSAPPPPPARPLSPDAGGLPPPSPRAAPPPPASDDDKVARNTLTVREKRVARRGAMGMFSLTEFEQYRELAINMTSRPEAAPEFEFVQRVACEHVLKLIVPGHGPVKVSLTPPMLDFEGRKCEVGSEIIDTLTLTNRGARLLKGSATIQELSKSVQVRIDPKKFALAPQQVAEIEVTASFGHLTTWRAVLELQFEGGVRLLVPVVGRSTLPKQIDAKRLVMGARLGGGTFASVYKATYNNMTVAVKSMFNPDDFKKELDVLSVLTEHPNVVNYLGYTMRSVDESCLVLEYVELGSLDQYIKPQSPPLSLLYCLRAASDAASGLAFLHNNCILHLDMKPANMLVVSLDPQALTAVKLTDFGMSRESNSRLTFVGTFVEGTALYMAPEMMQRVQSEKGDVYSLGMCLWEMLSRRAPYSDVTLSDAGIAAPHDAAQPAKLVSSFDLAQLKDKGASPGKLPSTVPPNVARTIDLLMCHDRDGRPTAMQAFSELVRLAMTSTAGAKASSTAASQFGTYRASTSTVAALAEATASSTAAPAAAQATAWQPAPTGGSATRSQHATIGRTGRAAVKLNAKEVAALRSGDAARTPPPATKPPAAPPAAAAAAAAAPPAIAVSPQRPVNPPPPRSNNPLSTSNEEMRSRPLPPTSLPPAAPVAAASKSSGDDKVVDDDYDDYEYEDTDDESSGESLEGEMPLPPMPELSVTAADGATESPSSDGVVVQRFEAAMAAAERNVVERLRLDIVRMSDIAARASDASASRSSEAPPSAQLPLLPPSDMRDSRSGDLPVPPSDYAFEKTQSLPSLSSGAPLTPRRQMDATDELMAALAIESLSPRALPLVSPRESTRAASAGAGASGLDSAVTARGRAECQQLDCYSAKASRTDANAVLDGRPVGAFVLRPSSQGNCVALSHVQIDGSVGHAVIKMRLALDGSIEFQMEDEGTFYPAVMALLSDHKQLDFAQARDAVALLRRTLG